MWEKEIVLVAFLPPSQQQMGLGQNWLAKAAFEAEVWTEVVLQESRMVYLLQFGVWEISVTSRLKKCWERSLGNGRESWAQLA